jgi:hypothetical protein
MRTVSAVVIAVVLGATAYALYWHHRLSPVMDLPGVGLTPTRFGLSPSGPVRPVSLGYVTFDVPAALAGEPVEVGNSLFVSLRNGDAKDPTLIVCPPLSDNDPEIRSLLNEYANLTEAPPPTYWELRKRALMARPFSFFYVPFHSKRHVHEQITLLSLKSTQVPAAQRIELFENARFGITITTREDYVFVQLADKHAGVGQMFMLALHGIDPHAFATALVNSYHLDLKTVTDARVKDALRGSGIARQMNVSALAIKVATDADAEEARLRKIMDEFRARRP